MARHSGFRFKDIHDFLQSLFGKDMHAKRVYSLANATLGVMTSASPAVNTIGPGLAQARGLLAEHAVKQVDRLMSNQCIHVPARFANWVPLAVGERKEILVAMNWTEFDKDGHSTIMLFSVTSHGRTTPLVWLTVPNNELKGRRNAHKYAVLARLTQVLPEDVEVTAFADRSAADRKLFHFLERALGFEKVISFRVNIHLTDAKGETRPAAERVGHGGGGHPASCQRKGLSPITSWDDGLRARQGYEGALGPGPSIDRKPQPGHWSISMARVGRWACPRH